ncbi:MAG: 1-deoxy-D-xylulose-5-phosphate reductoisomerase [Proteobacteria bacterium]|nr:1-deoxy-D-xylulose-5-phosphate reductoisomerase [Pseudomonadota bacterium]
MTEPDAAASGPQPSTRKISILGCTGSIGTQTLDVVARFPERLEVVALAGGRNVDLLIRQAREFRPSLVSVAAPEEVERVRRELADPAIRVVSGLEGLGEVASVPADLLIGALVGSLGLEPVVSALQAGNDVALANKEVLVTAGPLVLDQASRSGAKLRPLDSEHVAIAQCLAGHPLEAVRRIWLTASGGPFRQASPAEMAQATPEQALAHPNWDMGPKITIDSATLMNKAFEVIEARWLFDLSPERIGVIVHPESIIHSLVEFSDGSWLSQLGTPDMRIPIAYTLGLPERLPLPDLPPLDLVALGALHFEAPDPKRFPALRLVEEVLHLGGTAPALLNAANEVAVQAFLQGELPFPGIAQAAEAVLEREPILPGLELDEVRDADLRGRRAAHDWIRECNP